MAGIKIHQYPLERLAFGDDDYYDIDYWDGAAYQTAKIKGSTIKGAIRSGILTLYNDDGTLTENRTVDLDGFSLAFTGGSIGLGDDLTVVSNDAAKPYVASFVNSNGDSVLYIQNTDDNVGIGTIAPEDAAKLDIESTSKGLLIPRMTTTNRDAITITTGVESLLIYNTTTNKFEYVDSSLNWVALGGGAEALDDLTDVTTGLPGAPTEADDGRLLFYDYDSAEWISDETVTHGTVVINGKKSTAGTIAKGLPVYLVGFDADLHTVELANATSTNTMPVIGFTAEPLNNTDSKHITTFGKVTGLDTTSTVSTLNPNGETWVVNDALYMSTTAGGLTKVRPTGATTLIQRVAKILKVDATGGQIFVFNTARTAGLPNLGTDKIWIGDANGNPQEVDKSTIGGASIYTADDSLTGNRLVDLNSKTLTFTQTGNFDGLIVDYTSSGLTNYQKASLKLLSEANAGIFEVTGKQGSVLIEGNNTFTKKDTSGNTDFFIASNGGGYWKGATVTIGERTYGKTELLEGGVIRITDTALGVQHYISRGASNQLSYFYGQGYVNLAGMLFGATAKVGTEQFLSKGRTAIQGYNTLSGVNDIALEIYDGDTTPTRLWEFKNDGNLIGSGKRITNTIVNPTVQETTSAATFTINADEQNTGVLTAQAAALTVANPTGTAVQGQKLVYRIKDDGTGRAITWGADFRAIGVTLPTTTTASKLIYVGCIYNSTDSKWDVIAVNEEA